MQKLKIDSMLAFILLMLLSYGLLMVFSTSSVLSLELSDNKSMYAIFNQQLISVLVGLVAAVVIAKSDYTKWKPYVLWLNILTLILLCLVSFTPLGVSANGATRWINIGFQFQPSELAKFTIIVTMASMVDVANKYNELNKISTLVKFGLYLLMYGVLIGLFQNHASVILIIALTAGLILYFGGINKILFFSSGIGLAVLGFIIAMSSEFRRDRMLSFLDPLQDKLGDGHQMVQNWYALGSGGTLGIGLGYGRQKFGWLPEDHTDFILSIVGEELGYVGVLVLIILFFLLIVRSLFISIRSADSFGILLSAGVVAIIAIQVILNMAVISGLFPVTGIPLPFISYGGSSTIVMCMLMGVLFSVNGRVKEIKDKND